MILPTLCFRVALHDYLFVGSELFIRSKEGSCWTICGASTRQNLIDLFTEAERGRLDAFEDQMKGQPT